MKELLLVDGNAADLQVEKEILEAEYKVNCVKMDTEILEVLQERVIDLIVMDCEVLERSSIFSLIKGEEAWEDIPIIFLSGNEDKNLEAECIELGAQDFLEKPIHGAVLLSRIRRILEVEKKKNELQRQLNSKTGEMQQLADYTEELQISSRKDGLTGLWNRGFMESEVDGYLKTGAEGTLFILDMDNFKGINDNFGHLVGDSVLKQFAKILTSFTRDNDIAGRIGGDEFIIFYKGLTDRGVVEKRAQDIVSALQTKLLCPDGAKKVGASIGIATAPDNGTCFSDLYKYADRALYHVKQAGKNSFHFYNGVEKNEKDLEKSRAVDICTLKQMIEEGEGIKGAYHVAYEGFQDIYNFIRRSISRNYRKYQVILFTLTGKNNGLLESEELMKAMVKLKETVTSSMRCEDVAMNYSDCQYAVILVEASEDNATMVAERVVSRWKELLEENERINIYYDIEKVEPGNKE